MNPHIKKVPKEQGFLQKIHLNMNGPVHNLGRSNSQFNLSSSNQVKAQISGEQSRFSSLAQTGVSSFEPNYEVSKSSVSIGLQHDMISKNTSIQGRRINGANQISIVQKPNFSLQSKVFGQIANTPQVGRYFNIDFDHTFPDTCKSSEVHPSLELTVSQGNSQEAITIKKKYADINEQVKESIKEGNFKRIKRFAQSMHENPLSTVVELERKSPDKTFQAKSDSCTPQKEKSANQRNESKKKNKEKKEQVMPEGNWIENMIQQQLEQQKKDNPQMHQSKKKKPKITLNKNKFTSKTLQTQGEGKKRSLSRNKKRDEGVIKSEQTQEPREKAFNLAEISCKDVGEPTIKKKKKHFRTVSSHSQSATNFVKNKMKTSQPLLSTSNSQKIFQQNDEDKTYLNETSKEGDDFNQIPRMLKYNNSLKSIKSRKSSQENLASHEYEGKSKGIDIIEQQEDIFQNQKRRREEMGLAFLNNLNESFIKKKIEWDKGRKEHLIGQKPIEDPPMKKREAASPSQEEVKKFMIEKKKKIEYEIKQRIQEQRNKQERLKNNLVQLDKDIKKFYQASTPQNSYYRSKSVIQRKENGHTASTPCLHNTQTLYSQYVTSPTMKQQKIKEKEEDSFLLNNYFTHSESSRLNPLSPAQSFCKSPHSQSVTFKNAKIGEILNDQKLNDFKIPSSKKVITKSSSSTNFKNNFVNDKFIQNIKKGKESINQPNQQQQLSNSKKSNNVKKHKSISLHSSSSLGNIKTLSKKDSEYSDTTYQNNNNNINNNINNEPNYDSSVSPASSSVQTNSKNKNGMLSIQIEHPHQYELKGSYSVNKDSLKPTNAQLNQRGATLGSQSTTHSSQYAIDSIYRKLQAQGAMMANADMSAAAEFVSKDKFLTELIRSKKEELKEMYNQMNIRLSRIKEGDQLTLKQQPKEIIGNENAYYQQKLTNHKSHQNSLPTSSLPSNSQRKNHTSKSSPIKEEPEEEESIQQQKQGRAVFVREGMESLRNGLKQFFQNKMKGESENKSQSSKPNFKENIQSKDQYQQQQQQQQQQQKQQQQKQQQQQQQQKQQQQQQQIQQYDGEGVEEENKVSEVNLSKNQSRQSVDQYQSNEQKGEKTIVIDEKFLQALIKKEVQQIIKQERVCEILEAQQQLGEKKKKIVDDTQSKEPNISELSLLPIPPSFTSQPDLGSFQEGQIEYSQKQTNNNNDPNVYQQTPTNKNRNLRGELIHQVGQSSDTNPLLLLDDLPSSIPQAVRESVEQVSQNEGNLLISNHLYDSQNINAQSHEEIDPHQSNLLEADWINDQIKQSWENNQILNEQRQFGSNGNTLAQNNVKTDISQEIDENDDNYQNNHSQNQDRQEEVEFLYELSSEQLLDLRILLKKGDQNQIEVQTLSQQIFIYDQAATIIQKLFRGYLIRKHIFEILGYQSFEESEHRIYMEAEKCLEDNHIEPEELLEGNPVHRMQQVSYNNEDEFQLKNHQMMEEQQLINDNSFIQQALRNQEIHFNERSYSQHKSGELLLSPAKVLDQNQIKLSQNKRTSPPEKESLVSERNVSLKATGEKQESMSQELQVEMIRLREEQAQKWNEMVAQLALLQQDGTSNFSEKAKDFLEKLQKQSQINQKDLINREEQTHSMTDVASNLQRTELQKSQSKLNVLPTIEQQQQQQQQQQQLPKEEILNEIQSEQQSNQDNNEQEIKTTLHKSQSSENVKNNEEIGNVQSHQINTEPDSHHVQNQQSQPQLAISKTLNFHSQHNIDQIENSSSSILSNSSTLFDQQPFKDFTKKILQKCSMPQESVDELLLAREEAIEQKHTAQLNLMQKMTQKNRISPKSFERQRIRLEKWATKEKNQVKSVKLQIERGWKQFSEAIKQTKRDLEFIEHTKRIDTSKLMQSCEEDQLKKLLSLRSESDYSLEESDKRYNEIINGSNLTESKIKIVDHFNSSDLGGIKQRNSLENISLTSRSKILIPNQSPRCEILEQRNPDIHSDQNIQKYNPRHLTILSEIKTDQQSLQKQQNAEMQIKEEQKHLSDISDGDDEERSVMQEGLQAAEIAIKEAQLEAQISKQLIDLEPILKNSDEHTKKQSASEQTQIKQVAANKKRNRMIADIPLPGIKTPDRLIDDNIFKTPDPAFSALSQATSSVKWGESSDSRHVLEALAETSPRGMLSAQGFNSQINQDQENEEHEILSPFSPVMNFASKKGNQTNHSRKTLDFDFSLQNTQQYEDSISEPNKVKEQQSQRADEKFHKPEKPIESKLPINNTPLYLEQSISSQSVSNAPGLECATLNFVKDYLVAFSEFVKDNFREEFLDRVNIPLGMDSQEFLKTFAITETVDNSDGEITAAPIYPIVKYIHIQKPVISEELFGLFNDIFNRERDLSGMTEDLFIMESYHMKLIYDCFNEALDSMRPFGLRGKPLPWKINQNKLSSIIITPQNIEKILGLAIAKVLKWGSFLCGFIPERIESPTGEIIQIDDEYLNQIKEDRLAQMLENDVIENEDKWLTYEDEETDVQLEIAEDVFNTLVEETAILLYEIEMKKVNMQSGMSVDRQAISDYIQDKINSSLEKEEQVAIRLFGSGSYKDGKKLENCIRPIANLGITNFEEEEKQKKKKMQKDIFVKNLKNGSQLKPQSSNQLKDSLNSSF